MIAKNVLEVDLDLFSQFAPFWVYLFAVADRERPPSNERLLAASIVAVTVAVLVLYAL